MSRFTETQSNAQQFIKQVDIHSPEMYVIDFETLHNLCQGKPDRTNALSEFCSDESCWD